jgi:diguanylate cyclase (GGDEF)-like protein
MHPEDRERVVNFCVAQSKAGVDHEADYRALTRDGSYVWLRDVVHVVRDQAGVVEALVGFMFDISERKKTEEKLMCLQRELQDLSFKDGLTGLANRRRFDTLLYLEWDAACRNRKPISLLMIDIDFFKQYNDRYGHIQGDDCLKRVSKALATGATRPREFLARYGGEEFALVLPETDERGAESVATRCREALWAEGIPHEASSVAPIVTVSIGVGTVIPSSADELLHFIEAVDKRLYRAKQEGRNTMVLARPSSRPASV